MRTRVRTPGQNGSRERGFGTMKYEWLFREEIDSGLELVARIDAYRHDYDHVRPHEAIAWNRPADVYAGRAQPTIPNALRAAIAGQPPTLRRCSLTVLGRGEPTVSSGRFAIRRLLWRAWATRRLPRVLDRFVGELVRQSTTLEGLQQQILVLTLSEARRTRLGMVILPTQLVVGCHPSDYRLLTDGSPDIGGELNAEIRCYHPQAPSINLVVQERLTADRGVLDLVRVDHSAPTVVRGAHDEILMKTRVLGPEASLLVNGRTVALDGDRVTIGRRHDADVRLESTRVSATHAELALDDRGWSIRDVGSHNGTRLNGRRLTAAARLTHGDELDFGDVRATFQLAGVQ